tara:strand:- start:563 stop:712 length:150 start_codon:yes stop_codon:yes gene_type:complete
MNQKFTSNNIENDDFTPSTDEVDYKNLIIRLEEISATIALLEKQYLDKF